MDKPQNNQGNVEDVAWCPKCNTYCEKIWGEQNSKVFVHKQWTGMEYEEYGYEPNIIDFDYFCAVCDTPVFWEPTEKEKAEAIASLKDPDDIGIYIHKEGSDHD